MRSFVILGVCVALFSDPLLAEAVTEPTEVRFPRLTASTQKVADRYVEAYFDKDWDALAALASDSISFNDPTGRLIFGDTPPRLNKSAVLDGFRSGYAALEMRFSSLRQMYSGEHAFYEGTLDWNLHLPNRDVHSQVPIIVALRVVDSLVVAHTDFVDYQPFLDAEVASRLQAAKAVDSVKQTATEAPPGAGALGR